MTARRFSACYQSYCADCDNPIYPGDPAGFIPGLTGAHCNTCCDDFDLFVEKEAADGQHR